VAGETRAIGQRWSPQELGLSPGPQGAEGLQAGEATLFPKRDPRVPGVEAAITTAQRTQLQGQWRLQMSALGQDTELQGPGFHRPNCVPLTQKVRTSWDLSKCCLGTPGNISLRRSSPSLPPSAGHVAVFPKARPPEGQVSLRNTACHSPMAVLPPLNLSKTLRSPTAQRLT
jgi:hypothetical protein